MLLPPSLRTAASVSSAADALRSATATFAPSSAKRIAEARPIPLAAPVISALFPSSLRLILQLLAHRRCQSSARARTHFVITQYSPRASGYRRSRPALARSLPALYPADASRV